MKETLTTDHSGSSDVSKDKISNTPYDDVVKTLFNDCTQLMIPLVNEIFHENFSEDDEITILPNEHYISLPGTSTKEKITDTCFTIKGTDKSKQYHIECQSTTDNSMALRMFEYDSQIALDHGQLIGNKLIVHFPNSAVIFLRHNHNTPHAIFVEIHTPGGMISYPIPVLKSQTYTIDELFEKNCSFYSPFISSFLKKICLHTTLIQMLFWNCNAHFPV